MSEKASSKKVVESAKRLVVEFENNHPNSFKFFGTGWNGRDILQISGRLRREYRHHQRSVRREEPTTQSKEEK